MRVPLSWLREFVSWPWEPAELAERLTMVGVKVETVLEVGGGAGGVVAARVLRVARHPDPSASGDYWIVDLDSGTGRRQVVAGIANMKPGDVVPYAPPGSVLPGGWRIGPVEIKGVLSEGMVLSLSELVLGEKPREGEGVLVLPAGLEPGRELTQALGLPETVLELDLTPNYAVHCQSILGVAREVAALTGAGPAGVQRSDPYAELEPSGRAAPELCRVTIEEPELCPRYIARVIRGVVPGPSPWTVQFRLLAAGMRPINNVVDATNYVMLETGQPLHAFDLERLTGRHIIVRRARRGETIVTLDGVERHLLESDLVIADEAGPVAVAGVMGGEASEVSSSTRDILLESALFEPRSVRRTATRLALLSEAAGRFEKGVDPEGSEPASARAAALIARTGGGAPAPGAVDANPLPYRPREIALRARRVSALLGVDLDPEEVAAHLRRLGFPVRRTVWRAAGARARGPGDTGGDEAADLVVGVPSWRGDVFGEADLAEEVGRLYGYNRIPSALPRMVTTVGTMPLGLRLTETAGRTMVALGFIEVVSSSMVDPDRDAALSPLPEGRRALSLSNPLTGSRAAMRTGLLVSLVEAVAKNQARAERDLRLFEAAPVYWPRGGELSPDNLPEERRFVAAVATGRGPEACWRRAGQEPDFFYAKGLAAALLRDLGIVDWHVRPARDRRFHPGRQARILAGCATGNVEDNGSGGESIELGTVGELHPLVLRTFDVTGRVAALELDLEAVSRVASPEVRFEELPRYPAVTRDVAVVLPNEVEAAAIEAVIRESAGDLGVAVELFDVYQGPPVPEGRRSTAWRVTYRSPERSLTDAEVDLVHARVREALREKLGATLR